MLRYLCTNRLLAQIGIEPSDRCSFCSEQPESILHLLAECETVKTFWKEVKGWCQIKCRINLEVNDSNIILGITENASDNLFANMIILLAKQHIYSSRVRKHHPSMKALERLIEYTYKIECEIALRNDSWYKHQVKWKRWTQDMSMSINA